MPQLSLTAEKHYKAWQQWLLNIRRFSHRTVISYSRSVNAFLQFIEEQEGQTITVYTLQNISPSMIRSWLAYRHRVGYNMSSTANAIGGIRNFFAYLTRENIHNVAVSNLRPPKVPLPLPKALSIEDTMQMIAAIEEMTTIPWVGKRDKALLMLLYGGGLRINEALTLQYRDVPVKMREEMVLTVTGKGNKQRNVPLLPAVHEEIREYLAVCPYSFDKHTLLFRGLRGGKLDAAIFQKHLRHARLFLGLPETVTPHPFRHSFATHLLQNGANIREIQELLGHKNIRTTQRYTKVGTPEIFEAYAQCMK